MAITDTLITIGVLLGVFLLAYSAIRQQGIKETVDEIREIIQGKADDIKEGELKYA